MTLDSHNPHYVNPFTRGTPTPAGLRFSSNVVGGIEIAVSVAKRDPVASDFDRFPSLQGSGFRKTGAGSAQPAPWPALPPSSWWPGAGVGERAGVNPALDGDRRRPPGIATGHHPPDLRPATVHAESADKAHFGVFG